MLCSHSVRRNLERINHIVPDIETKQDPYAVLSQSCEGDHFEGKRLNLLYWLAGRALNRPVKFQLECLDQALEEIQRRADCSDFYMAALLRHIRCYGLPQQMKDRAKEAILHYRYWMTENGSDGMCFWSENHSLLSSSTPIWPVIFSRKIHSCAPVGPGWSRAAGLFPVSANGCGMCGIRLR